MRNGRTETLGDQVTSRHVSDDEIFHAMTPSEADAYIQQCERLEAAQATARSTCQSLRNMRARVRRRIRQAEAMTGKDGT
jgi:hypothetical protein